VVEELETGKEELNSLNEELLTVNTELERKNQELSLINSDMRNLLNSIEEAIIFLDTNLRIRRFTSQMDKITNLLPVDMNRPIQDIAMNLKDTDFIPDIKEVLHTLNTKEREVQTKDGHWYNLKILPYRTVDNIIDGVVVTFNDIDVQKKVQTTLMELTSEAQASQAMAESIVNTIKEPLLILDETLLIRSANTSFLDRFETTPKNVRGYGFAEILDGMFDSPTLIDGITKVSTKGQELNGIFSEIVMPGGVKTTIKVSAKRLPIPKSKSALVLVNVDKVGPSLVPASKNRSKTSNKKR